MFRTVDAPVFSLQTGRGRALSAPYPSHALWRGADPENVMELEGRLNPSLSLPEVLQFVSMGKMTGALTVVQGDYSVTLMLRQGRLVNSSSLGRPRRLGQLVVAHGLVERSALDEVLHRQRGMDPQPLLGHLLVESGLITTEQLRHAIRLQLEEEMWDLFSLQEGSFRFEHRKPEDIGEVLVELEVEPLIMEGTRRLDEWARIVKNIPGDHVTPVIVVPPGGVDREALQLSENEWRVLSLINGFYNVGSLAMRSGIGRFETYRVLNSFMASGLVVPYADALPVGPSPDLADPAPVVSHPPRDCAPADKPDSARPGSSSAKLIALFRRAGPATGSDTVDQTSGPPVAAGEAGPPLKFHTWVGFVASLATRVMEKLMASPDFPVGPDDSRLLAYHWNGVLMTYPKADLVRAHDNRLDASRFDGFVKYAGTTGPLRGVYEDTLEALVRLMRLLYLLAAQRLGTRAAQRILGDELADHRQRAVIGAG